VKKLFGWPLKSLAIFVGLIVVLARNTNGGTGMPMVEITLQVIGLLFLVAALTNSLKWSLTASAVLMIVGLGSHSLLSTGMMSSVVILSLSIASVIVLLWGVWGSRLRIALIVLGLLLIGYDAFELSPFLYEELTALNQNPASFFESTAVLLVGIVLLVGALLNQIRWTLAIAGVLLILLR
jgi:hypothetical protein